MGGFDLRKFLTENKLTETSRLLNEEEGDLLKLVGKDKDDDLTMSDASTIGRKVADMEGDELESYLGMMSALGGYYSGTNPEAQKKLEDLRKAMFDAYNKEKGNETEE